MVKVKASQLVRGKLKTLQPESLEEMIEQADRIWVFPNGGDPKAHLTSISKTLQNHEEWSARAHEHKLNDDTVAYYFSKPDPQDVSHFFGV